MRDLTYLWKQRERRALLSRGWFKVWAKRIVLLPALTRILVRRAVLRWRGAAIGSMSVVSKVEVGGDPSRLRIGNGSFVGRAHIALHESVTIGDRVVVGDFVTLLTGTHSTSDPDWNLIARPIVIEDYAWIGQGATILPGVIVGTGAVVGAASVVTQSIEPYAVVSGNPARASEARRPAELQYEPVRRIACVAAWVGHSAARTEPREND